MAGPLDPGAASLTADDDNLMKIPALLLCCLGLAARAAESDPAGHEPGPGAEAFAAFRSPATETRPFVRWWWNGGRVDAAEIERQIEVLHQAGIGGVEINTIAMEQSMAGDARLERHPEVAWLSPEWVKLVGTAVRACRQRGMTPDLIVGSGWPFGARFLEPAEQTQRVMLVKTVLQGPRRVQLNVNDLVREQIARERAQDKGRDLPDPTSSRLLFLRLVPASALAGDFSAGTDLTAEVTADGRVSLDLPAGEHHLFAGNWQTGFTHVKLGAPGADGPVVNHFDAAAVRRYLEAMSTALAPVLAGGGLRAAFVDSLELDHANWTADLPQEFLRRRGYDLLPYLPFVLDAPSVTAGAFNDTVRRVRYDFCRTLTELFEERFTRTYVAWAAAHGLQARMQAYGREAHPLHGSMGVALPEGETWLWIHPQDQRKIRVESTVANKYVASAANLTGQRLRSFEAMTNAVPVFRETLENFKQGMDLSVLSGLNHPILHGFNYSPPDAGYPGWMRFGSYFSPQNPWWPHFRLFADYAARLGTVLRASEAQASIAVLAPRPEEWAGPGLLYQPFPEVAVPWYQYKLTEAIHQAGYNADYISERVLEQGASAGGKFRFGPRAYDVILLEEVTMMEPGAAASLVRFVASGGTLIVVGGRPARAPGRFEAERRDAEVAAAMRRLEAAAQPGEGRVLLVPPPPPDGLLAWTATTLAAARAPRDVAFDQPRENISQVFHRDGDRAIYFLANTSVDEAVDLTAVFHAARGAAWLWDPQTGSRERLPAAGGGPLALRFAPLESKLIVFEPGDPAGSPPAAPRLQPGVALTLAGPWSVELRVGGSPRVFQRSLPALTDLSLQEDPALRDFGGTLVYHQTFEVQPEGLTTLDLGHVNGTTQVWLNGEPLGVQWWGRHTYDISRQLRPGPNKLKIEVTTTLANQMRSLKGNPSAQRWAWWAPPIEMGLTRPVRILRHEN